MRDMIPVVRKETALQSWESLYPCKPGENSICEPLSGSMETVARRVCREQKRH